MQDQPLSVVGSTVEDEEALLMLAVSLRAIPQHKVITSGDNWEVGCAGAAQVVQSAGAEWFKHADAAHDECCQDGEAVPGELESWADGGNLIYIHIYRFIYMVWRRFNRKWRRFNRKWRLFRWQWRFFPWKRMIVVTAGGGDHNKNTQPRGYLTWYIDLTW